MTEKHRTWVEIDKKALRYNLKLFKNSFRKTTDIMAVVKSNAYGHGMVESAKVFDKSGARWFGVDSFEEALELRKNGIKKPILVLGYTLPANYKKATEKNISITVSSLSQLKNLNTKNLKTKIHLKVDTGLHRQGVNKKEIRSIISILKDSEIELEGLYSHFAGAENREFDKYSERQMKVFQSVLSTFKKNKFKPMTHMAGTAATLCLKDSRLDLVRIGVGLYGLWPSSETKECVKGNLKPALTWKSVVSEVKEVKKMSGVGYDLTEKVSENTKVAIVPVGYWHGYVRAYGREAFVSVRGEKAKVLGNVSMDMIAVDVTGVRGVKEGDEIKLLGKEIPADELAGISDTINYEVVTRINPLIKRIFV